MEDLDKIFRPSLVQFRAGQFSSAQLSSSLVSCSDPTNQVKSSSLMRRSRRASESWSFSFRKIVEACNDNNWARNEYHHSPSSQATMLLAGQLSRKHAACQNWMMNRRESFRVPNSTNPISFEIVHHSLASGYSRNGIVIIIIVIMIVIALFQIYFFSIYKQQETKPVRWALVQPLWIHPR